mgnify:CR=1 FL=1|tara:strand:- start:3048 stop:3272 length:225 start_codon:yes stop_codon:yes gene_type:complete
MINKKQTYFLIQRDFMLAYGPEASDQLEKQYCKKIGRPASTLNRLRLWKNASLQDLQAVHTIMDYEKRINGKTN